MRGLLFLLSAAFAAFGAIAISSASAVFQEIAGLICFVIAAIQFSSAGIIDVLHQVRKDIQQDLQQRREMLEAYLQQEIPQRAVNE